MGGFEEIGENLEGPTAKEETAGLNENKVESEGAKTLEDYLERYKEVVLSADSDPEMDPIKKIMEKAPKEFRGNLAGCTLDLNIWGNRGQEREKEATIRYIDGEKNIKECRIRLDEIEEYSRDKDAKPEALWESVRKELERLRFWGVTHSFTSNYPLEGFGGVNFSVLRGTENERRDKKFMDFRNKLDAEVDTALINKGKRVREEAQEKRRKKEFSF